MKTIFNLILTIFKDPTDSDNLPDNTEAVITFDTNDDPNTDDPADPEDDPVIYTPDPEDPDGKTGNKEYYILLNVDL